MTWPLLDVLFSRTCEGCGCDLAAESGALCWDCRLGLHPVQVPFCERCGDPVAGVTGGPFECAWCRRNQPSFTWARSAVRYDGIAAACIRRFKYHAGIWLQTELVDWLWALWRTCPPPLVADMVLPVPLYRRRERERGFNQAALLGRGLAKRLGAPFQGRLLRRQKPTTTQTHLTAAQRVHNVRGVFSAPAPQRLQGARVVLVDDVMTTGATVNECARVLLKAGARRVMILTAARG